MSESFAVLFEQSLNYINLKPGSIIKATIVYIEKDWIKVNAGLKSEVKINIDQFKNDKDEVCVKIGDKINVVIETIEDGFGETRLSRSKAKRLENWKNLEKAFNNNEIVKGIIIGKVKGGFTVDINSIRAFLPGSLVDIRTIRETLHLEKKYIDFKLIKLDKKRNNVVVSRRAVLEIGNESLKKKINKAKAIKGIVKNLTDYGAFIDLGGMDGLLHITDMAWKRVKHPSEIVSLGEEIKVKILRVDLARNRVSLGLKQLSADPWRNVKVRYPVGKKVKACITNITDYGCFAEIEDGIEGLVHISELDWTNKNINPSKLVNIGERVEVMILEIDELRRRISLGIKQCKLNPWETFGLKYKRNDRVNGVVKSITDFGIFVGLNGGIDGLVHISDISWNELDDKTIRNNFRKGKIIETLILSIDPERERISLSVKHLKQDPINFYYYYKGSLVNGELLEISATDVSALVKLKPNILANLNYNPKFTLCDQLEAYILSVDLKNRKITLSETDT
ncbi:30S ribosomal protein S1 [Candidatus Portiera aleyrodidarum]|uniref:Small ribosomal subunit protein bS1 n=1 Tax=Candidatus Portiera aleyrodidarum TaxID=91844 RepID=A0A6S6S1R2_9GAMM|nr:30S ribosomal protein S1 [Candidatus Portiera aleyrodidarum]CAA3707983.1 30S ribosomal protein S1 [Candidatus Portiera aleyrodidarum]